MTDPIGDDRPMITLPRSVVEQLVDPTYHGVFDMETGECNYCWGTYEKSNHDATCPVRLVQEALKT